MTFQLLPEYQEAINSIVGGNVTFVTGNAGSGKSTFIRYIRTKVKNAILMAPTGIAAINVKGRTIHSVFKFPPTFLLPNDIRRANKNTRKYLKATNLLIFDEISMVSSNLLDGVDSYLRLNIGVDKPFGGIPVLLVGDLFQLPPIVTDNVRPLFEACYKSAHFFDSAVINELRLSGKFNVVTLNKVLRQSDDVFIGILNNIRTGNDIENTIDLLNDKVKYVKSAPDGYVQITPYNDVSNVTNNRKLAEIVCTPRTYYGNIVNKFNIKNLPVDQAITLKLGAQVMITKNIDLNVVNGTIGKVVELKDESVVVETLTGRYEIQPTQWDEYGYVTDVHGNYKSDVVGSFQQIPIKLAWSMTIHKVQSATIERLYIDLDRGTFAPGMLYVALSRAVSLDSLVLSKPIDYEDVIVDQLVIDFYNDQKL